MLPPVFVMLHQISLQQWVERVPFWLWQLNSHLDRSYPHFVDTYEYDADAVLNVPNYVIGEQSFRMLIGESFLTPDFLVDENTPLSIENAQSVVNPNTLNGEMVTLSVTNTELQQYLKQQYADKINTDGKLIRIDVSNVHGTFFILRDEVNDFPVEGIGAKRHYATLIASYVFNTPYFVQADSNISMIFDFDSPTKWVPYDVVINDFVSTLDVSPDVAIVGLDKTGLRNRTTENTASLDKFYLCRTVALLHTNYNVYLNYQLEDIEVQYRLVCTGNWRLRKLVNYSIVDGRQPNRRMEWSSAPGVWVGASSVKVIDTYTANNHQLVLLQPIVEFYKIVDHREYEQKKLVTNDCQAVYAFPRLPTKLTLTFCDSNYRRDLYDVNVPSFDVKQYLCRPVLSSRRDVPQTDGYTQKMNQRDLNPNLGNLDTSKYTRGSLLAYLLFQLQNRRELNTLTTLQELLTNDVVKYGIARAKMQHIVCCLWIFHEYPQDIIRTLPELLVDIPVAKSYLQQLATKPLPFSRGDSEEVHRLNYLYRDLIQLLEWYTQFK